MSEHHNAPKAHEFHTLHEDHAKGPSNPKEINPKVSSDIAYWSKQFNVTSQVLHEAIRSHGTQRDQPQSLLRHRLLVQTVQRHQPVPPRSHPLPRHPKRSTPKSPPTSPTGPNS